MKNTYCLFLLFILFACRQQNQTIKTPQKQSVENTNPAEVYGWWKLTNATYRPIRLINAGYAEDFTMHLNKNGNAEIYINNRIDSIVDYKWQLKDSVMSFGRLCIAGSNSPIYFLGKQKMIMSFDPKRMDTLTFVRCKEIRK